jgi:hypothetical protein
MRVKGLSRLDSDAVRLHRTNRTVVGRELERMADVLRRGGLRSAQRRNANPFALGPESET